MRRCNYKEPTITLNDFNKIKSGQSEIYTGVDYGTKISDLECEACHKIFSKRVDEFLKNPNRCLCKSCAIKSTCIDRYGVSNVMKLESSKDKAIQTNIIKYGYPSHNQNPEIKKKKQETFIRHFGVRNIFALPEFKDRLKIINLFKFGYINPAQSPEIKDKIKSTNIKRYGHSYYSQTSEFKSRFKSTCMRKYGFDHFNKSKESHKNRKTRLKFDNIYFDSKPELDFYIKCKNENKDIIYQPLSFEYSYNNSIHLYFPDFMVDGELIEIKGKHFYDPIRDSWTNPFNENDIERQRARYNCAIANNVKIIYV